MVRIVNDHGEQLREEAKEWALVMVHYYRLARIAYENNDGYIAKQHSEEAKYCRNRMEEANASAANVLFNGNNEKRSIDVIDLHRLYKIEAVAKLSERINYIVREGKSKLIVIVGQGHHSESGCILKPAVKEFASINNIPYSFPYNNSGRIHLDLRQFMESTSGYDNTVPSQPNSFTSPITTYLQRPQQVSSSLPSYTNRSTDSNDFLQTVKYLFIAFVLYGLAMYVTSKGHK